MQSSTRLWPQFSEGLVEHFDAEDDPELWEVAVEEILRDATFLCQRGKSKAPVFAHVGRCSHWLSPHNNGSWFRDGRFAWPSGYGSSGVAIFGLPEFDWSVSWEWDRQAQTWEIAQRVQGKRPLMLRMAVPSRSVRHQRAVVHTAWTSGTPTTPKKKLLQAYGFEKTAEQWQLLATCGDDEPYEIE